MRTNRLSALSGLTLCAAFLNPAWADFSDTREKIEEALQGSVRSEAEIARDDNRKPVETLEFFGLRDDMRVLELVPGTGWYTKVLAPTLHENGKLFVSIGTERVEDGVLNQPGFEEVEVINPGLGYGDLEGLSFDQSDLDMVLTFRNLHNMEPETRASLNSAVFEALESGGLYGVVDHTRRHMEPGSRANGRRVDPVQAIKEAVDAGFEFVDYSDLHYRPQDDLSLEVGHESVTGQTDRFTLLFRKPE